MSRPTNQKIKVESCPLFLQAPAEDVYYVPDAVIPTSNAVLLDLDDPQAGGGVPPTLWSQITAQSEAWRKLRDSLNYLGQSMIFKCDRYFVNQNYNLTNDLISSRSKLKMAFILTFRWYFMKSFCLFLPCERSSPIAVIISVNGPVQDLPGANVAGIAGPGGGGPNVRPVEYEEMLSELNQVIMLGSPNHVAK